MLKVPAVDICIESPKQNEYVKFVSNKNLKGHILGRGSYGRVYKAIYRGLAVKLYWFICYIFRALFLMFRSTCCSKDYQKN